MDIIALVTNSSCPAEVSHENGTLVESYPHVPGFYGPLMVRMLTVDLVESRSWMSYRAEDSTSRSEDAPGVPILGETSSLWRLGRAWKDKDLHSLADR